MLSLTRACVCFSFSHGGSSVQKRRQESRSRYLAYRGESSRKRSDCKLQLLELDIIRRLRPSVCEDHRSLGTKPHWPHPLGFIMAAAAVMRAGCSVASCSCCCCVSFDCVRCSGEYQNDSVKPRVIALLTRRFQTVSNVAFSSWWRSSSAASYQSTTTNCMTFVHCA